MGSDLMDSNVFISILSIFDGHLGCLRGTRLPGKESRATASPYPRALMCQESGAFISPPVLYHKHGLILNDKWFKIAGIS